MFKDVTEGKVVDTFKAMVEAMFKGAATAKGADKKRAAIGK